MAVLSESIPRSRGKPRLLQQGAPAPYWTRLRCPVFALPNQESKHPAAGECSLVVCWLNDEAPILTALQLAVADAWMFAAAACFKAAEAGSDVTRY